jgi:hypothetical protein
MANKSTWSKWYAENKDDYNDRRKQQRANDPELRAKIAEHQREYRAARPKVERPPTDPDAPRLKTIGDRQVEVYRISYVAKVCNRTVQVIRLWERDNRIPKPSVKGGHRYYTQHQIDLLIQFSELMDEVRYEPSVREAAIKAKSAEIFAHWAPTN